MLALPLSAFYSVVILVGLSVGLGVAILTLGLPLVLMMGFWRWMARFERWLGERLLGVPLPSPYRPSSETRWFARLLARTADMATWKDLAYRRPSSRSRSSTGSCSPACSARRWR